MTKFHEDQKINVASRVLTRKNALPPGSHVFQPTSIIFELFKDIIGMNLLTKFHEDRTLNVASRVKNAPPTNLLTKCHEDWTINVASREKCTAPGGHVFKATKTIFELIRDIIATNLLTMFHDDRKINVTSRVKIAPPPWWPYITGMNLLTKFHEDLTINVASRVKNAPPLGGHVFQANVTIFELIQDIIKTNFLTIFHQDWTINVTSRVLTRKHSPPPGGHFYKDQTITVASRVKNAPSLGSHVFQANVTIFELIQDMIETNLLTKFHEDWKINVDSRELTRQMLRPHNGRRTKSDHKSSP
ncbi:hypothetical protein DPMN_034668 [Dreissena polymorpha]|uniref:Uncharacterized protein n=1 Tax=Dreissena polymorpha TaxID=45954 RepID=A0A9D4M831_DREPO|nr:hypothetical protein DPMN_034668 [Dreissena polymorpha]